MKRNVFAAAVLLAMYCSAGAQDLKVAQVDPAAFNVTTRPVIPTDPLKDEDRDRFAKAGTDKILVVLGAIPAGKRYTLNGAAMEADNSFDITDDIRNAITTKKDKRSFVFREIDAANVSPGRECGSLQITWKPASSNAANAPGQQLAKAAEESRQKIIAQWKRRPSFADPYNNKLNRIDLYFDENGRLLNHLPVNMDQNDVFYMNIVCLKGDEEKYFVNVTEGDFSPVDLAIRPFEKIKTPEGQALTEEAAKDIPKEYVAIQLQSGPYTSDLFKFQIAYDSAQNKLRNGPEYKTRINKLFHVGVGVSILSSSLQNPDFRTFAKAPGDTTLVAVNGGRRTLFSINAVWYWTIFHQRPKGSVIPNGRDVMKDEPTFSLSRVFPTVGVSLDSKFKENFFAGLVYEFARGGSFTAGVHYGRISRLVDQRFKLGDTQFSGTDADIKLDQVYKAGFYLGLLVDTRIINVLFSKGQ